MELVFRETIPEKAKYKLKINGFHLVGTREALKKRKASKNKDNLSAMFEIGYKESKVLELTGNEQVFYINKRMVELYKSDFSFNNLVEMAEFSYDFVEYIEKKLKQKIINLILRKQRFKEKANLHCWNYFVTQTYDSSKYNDEEEFKKAYKTCLSHLATDFGWRYMGVWERGSRTGRLHFHGVFYIPQGAMKGFLKASKYYNHISKSIEKSMINSFFAVRFGRNDFQSIKSNITGITNYIVKYIGKTDENIVYSRHIDSCINVELEKEDVAFGYKLSYCTKFIVFDEIFKGTILDAEIKRGLDLQNATGCVSS